MSPELTESDGRNLSLSSSPLGSSVEQRPGSGQPQRRNSSFLKSPSSPNVVDGKTSIRPAVPRAVSRSRTLPRGLEAGLSRRRNSEIDSLVVDGEKVLKLRRWILGFVLVDFDLDQGPVVNGCFPPLWLSPSEAENIAFSSFPDSLQFDQGSQTHSFCIREQRISENSSHPSNDRPISEDGFIYGYSHFTQRRDTASKRGYQQRSLVILAHRQYPAFFSKLCMELGSLYEAHGIPMLETAFQNIANWPEPVAGATLELGVLGSVLEVELPHTVDDQQLTETPSFHEKYDPNRHILASSTPLTPPPLLLFEASLSHLWSIWECLVLCEPLLVFGSSPAMTSQAVWWFRDLLRPIPQASDIRPYFTIHDQDHSMLVNKRPPKTGLLVGVTNPIFDKSCSHWPHVLSLGRNSHGQKSSKHAQRMIAAGPAPGWTTKTHKRFISKDRVLLKQLEEACRGDHAAKMEASLILRRHFCSRTTALLVPLNRYLNTLIPSPAQFSVAQPTERSSRLKAFNTVNFLSSLKTHGSALPFRSSGKQREFYERWLRTPAFALWLARQEEVVQRVLRENAERNSLQDTC